MGGLALGIGVGLTPQSGGGGAPVAPAVRQVQSLLGDSFIESNQQVLSRTGSTTATDDASYQLAQLMGVTQYTTPTQASITTGVVRCGYGGQTAQTVANHLTVDILPADSARQGDNWIFWAGQNDTPNTTGVTDYLAAADQVITAITTGGLGHDRLLIMPPHQDANAMVSSPITGGWVRAARILAALRTDATRRKYLWDDVKQYYRGLSPNGGGGNGVVVASTDDLSVARLSSQRGLIASLCKSAAADQSHPNYIMAPMQAAFYKKASDAFRNQTVLPIGATIFCAYDIAQGTKLTSYIKGYATSATLTTDDPTLPGLFTVALKSGTHDTIEYTRTATSWGTSGRIINLVVTVQGVDTSGNTVSATCNIRIAPTRVNSANTAPTGCLLPRDTVPAQANDNRTVAASSQSWPYMQAESAPFASGQPITFVACGLYFQQDTTDSVLLQMKNSTSGSITVQRISGKFNFLVKSTTGTNLLNWSQTVTPVVNLANGPFNIMFSFDNNGGTPRGSMWLWSSGTGNKNISPASALTAGTAATDGSVTLFSGSNDQPTTGFGLKSLFLSNTWQDGSSAGVLDQFWNSSTGVPVDLGDGTLGGTRYPYLKFFPGDVLYNGGQFGSGPAFAARDNWLEGFTNASSDPLPW